jgi:hypothetical protein
MIERSGDAVCGLHYAQGDEERMFLGLTSKARLTVSPSLDSKSVAMGFPVCASKPADTVWWFGPQNHRDGFLVWASKSSGLLVVPQNWLENEDGVGHESRSSGLCNTLFFQKKNSIL